jgi:hypothetical protein
MRFICYSLLLTIFFSCSNTNTTRLNLIDFVPKNSSVIIKTSNIESLKSSLTNSDFLQKFSKINSYKNLENKLNALTILKPKGDLLICFSNDFKDSLQFSIITKFHANLFKTDSLKNYIEETLTTKNQSIKKSTLKKQVFYSAVIDSTFFASSSKGIIDAVFNSSVKDFELEKIYNTASNDKTISVIIKSNSPFVTSFFIEDGLNLKTFSNYITADVDINQNNIYFNGITKASDSTKSFINVFKNTIPQEYQTQNITPSNSDGFLSFTFNNFKNFNRNLKAFNKKDSISYDVSLFENIIEVGTIYQDKERAIILNSIDNIATEDALLNDQTIIETFRQIDIYAFSKPNLFYNTFHPLITFKNATKYCILDNYFVFASNSELLQSIITNYQNKTTLSETDFFKSAKEQLSDAASLMVVANPSTLKHIINKNINDDLNLNFDAYNTSMLQFIYDTNFAHVNGIIKKGKNKAIEKSVSEELNIKLDTDILNKPQFVTNHITKEKEIVVQDVKNNLYLISNKGKILWKKQLNGAVLGAIEQIDIYKNGRLQLAFATPNNIYVIDRTGNEVKPFPAKFNDEITQPLAVFDYDKNKNYRFLVTQGKNILMYDVNAKNVNGFTFKQADNTIVSTPKHFRIGSKDYILLKTSNKIYILDRTGNTRITPKTTINYSTEPVFLNNNTFTTTAANGNIVSIDEKGNVVTKNLNLSEKHSIEASSKTLVTFSENKLIIKNNTVELDYGNYTKPSLFYIKDKIYVSITDLQTQKIYIYDSQGNLLENLPVYGNSEIALDNIDKDASLEFVTKGENNSILLYKLN